MRVAFVQYGTDIEYATMMVASCKRLGYEVWQLSDHESPDVAGVDRVWRKAKDCPSMLYRARRLAELDAPYVMLDTDMIVVRDISDGFSDKAASLSWRPNGTIMMKRGIKRVDFMPYNGGIVFVNDSAFMQAVSADMETMEPELQEWYGDQIALRNATRKFQVRELREPEWNYTPRWIGDTIPGVRVYHFKGNRKRWMKSCFEGDW